MQVHLLLKEANDETEMLALITAVRVVLQYLLECNIRIFFKMLLAWMPCQECSSSMYGVNVRVKNSLLMKTAYLVCFHLAELHSDQAVGNN